MHPKDTKTGWRKTQIEMRSMRASGQKSETHHCQRYKNLKLLHNTIQVQPSFLQYFICLFILIYFSLSLSLSHTHSLSPSLLRSFLTTLTMHPFKILHKCNKCKNFPKYSQLFQKLKLFYVKFQNHIYIHHTRKLNPYSTHLSLYLFVLLETSHFGHDILYIEKIEHFIMLINITKRKKNTEFQDPSYTT